MEEKLNEGNYIPVVPVNVCFNINIFKIHFGVKYTFE